MGEVQFFLTKIVKATVARLGVLSILLLPSPPVIDGQQSRSVSELLRQFQGETVFWRQFEVATAIVAANDTTVLPQLEPWLTHEDRELRGNAAFIFARLGDPRGFDVIVAILGDRCPSRRVQSGGAQGWGWHEGPISGGIADPFPICPSDHGTLLKHYRASTSYWVTMRNRILTNWNRLPKPLKP
jgi:HEAT repeat protein